jgi:hypothetical protein
MYIIFKLNFLVYFFFSYCSALKNKDDPKNKNKRDFLEPENQQLLLLRKEYKLNLIGSNKRIPVISGHEINRLMVTILFSKITYLRELKEYVKKYKFYCYQKQSTHLFFH